MPGPAAFGALALLVAALGLLYAPALAGMQAMWDATPMYSFGYIVPLVGAYLVWMRRDALAAVTPRPSVVSGSATLAVAVALLVAGRLTSVQLAEQLSFVVALVATVLLVWGAAVTRVIWVALAYLLLMVPIWDGFTEPLHAPFQRLSARTGVALLQAFDIPASQEGLYIYLPHVTLEVARACSGVNYLVAVLALGVPLAYLWLPTLWRRVLLVGSAVLIAALSNGLRVALIGALAYAEIGSPLHGPAHMLHGLFVSGIGYVVLLAGLRVLAPRGAGVGAGAERAVAAEPSATSEHAAPIRGDATRGVPIWRVMATALTFLAIWAAVGLYRPVAAPLARPLATLPTVLGDWHASGADILGTAWWRDADDALRRTYVAPDGARVDVAIGYFAVQRQGREAASHLTAPLHRAMVGVQDLGATGDSVRVGRVRLPVAGGHRDGVFWYDVSGQVVTSPAAAKLATARSVLTTRRAPGMIVVLLEVDRSPEGPAAGRPALRLARELAHALQQLTGESRAR